MSFIKSLILAIFATLFLTYVFGISIMEMLNVDVYVDDKLMEPLKAISISALVTVTLVVAALAIVLSVFGSIIFIMLLIFGGLALVMIGIFWPILLIAAVIWLLTRNGQSKHSHA